MSDAKTIYNVSVDSRSRPRGQPEHSFTVDLGRTMQRVKTIQMASAQIPDTRYAFGSSSALQYSEPLTIEPNTYLYLQQISTTLHKTTNVQTSSTNTIELLIPPTLNPITHYNVNTDTVTTQYNHGLHFGTRYYGVVGLHMSVICGAFPQTLMTQPMPAPFPQESGPVLNKATIINKPNGTCNQYKYVNGYLDALTSSAGDYDARHIIDGVATSYVYAPKPTLVELFMMLNAATSDLKTATSFSAFVSDASNTVPITVTTSVDHTLHDCDQITISGVQGNTGANGTFIITVTGLNTFELVGSIGSGTYVGGGVAIAIIKLNSVVQFGFDDEKNQIVCGSPTQIIDTRTTTTTITTVIIGGSGTLAHLLGFSTSCLDPPALATPAPHIIRSVALKPGNHSSTQLCDMLNIKLNPLMFEVPAAQRTLHFAFACIDAYDVVLPYGRFTVSQITKFLNTRLNVPPFYVYVTYNSSTCKFTFKHTQGHAFSLLFNNSTLVAENFGFDTINYTQQASYTSIKQALHGMKNTLIPPENTYTVTASTVASQPLHFTFTANNTPQYTCTSAVSDNVWNVYNTSNKAHIGFSYTILSAQHPYITTDILLVNNTTPIFVKPASMTGLTTGDIVIIKNTTAANGTWRIKVEEVYDYQYYDHTAEQWVYGPDYDAWISLYYVGSSDKSIGTGVSDEDITAGAFTRGGHIYSVSTNGVGTNTFHLILQSQWGDTSINSNAITLKPTVSVHSTLNVGTIHSALGTPSASNPVFLKSVQRNVFQLLFTKPDAKACNFGFPPIAWPPSTSTSPSFDIEHYPTYNPVTKSIPVSCSYTSPCHWNSTPPDYIIVVLSNIESEVNSHVWNGENKTIFAKLHITTPFVLVSQNFLFQSTAGYDRFNQIKVSFFNPDWTPCYFNGKPINFNLLFTLMEDTGKITAF